MNQVLIVICVIVVGFSQTAHAGIDLAEPTLPARERKTGAVVADTDLRSYVLKLKRSLSAYRASHGKYPKHVEDLEKSAEASGLAGVRVCVKILSASSSATTVSVSTDSGSGEFIFAISHFD